MAVRACMRSVAVHARAQPCPYCQCQAAARHGKAQKRKRQEWHVAWALGCLVGMRITPIGAH
eukprot:scaffold11917_cov128-Isochrysis_galbana.AAC.2